MSLLSNSQEINTIDSTSSFAVSKFSRIIMRYLEDFQSGNYLNLIIVCIGTDRSTGDSLGPLTGYKLSSLLKSYPNVHVLGTLEEPIHAKNLSDKIKMINENYNNSFIIAIDACLGAINRIGYITIHNGPLKPGTGVHKDLPHIGNIHITGVVNLSGFMEYIILQNTRLNTVMKMAEVLASSISYSVWKVSNSSLPKLQNQNP